MKVDRLKVEGGKSGEAPASGPYAPASHRGNHVLVTGGAGFIGSHLVERLLADGKRVVVIDDCSTGSLDNLSGVRSHPRLTLIVSPVSQCKRLPDLVARAESIYHLAAVVGVQLVTQSSLRALQTNLRETECLLELAARQGVPFLLTSSSEVYGRSRKAAFAETDDLVIGPPNLARWSYACSKLADEFLALAYAREHGLPVVIARLFNTVGPRQTGRYGMVLPRFIGAARAGRPLRVFGTGRQTRCFCWIGDAVEALVQLQTSPTARGQVFNVGGTEEISIGALARLVMRTLRSQSRLEFVPYARACGPGFEDMRRRRPVVSKLARTVGFRPRTRLREIIRRTAEAHLS
ncbi:MAG: GDP-mannose 4,6-dehydratase [Verrucomicrobia bacterium]|nr:GDP-mannose 4,6-dehydratase [Verrucomicrobiota bacterium]